MPCKGQEHGRFFVLEATLAPSERKAKRHEKTEDE